MSKWVETFNKLKIEDDYESKTQLLNYIIVSLEMGQKLFGKSDFPTLANFILDEMKKLLDLIPKTMFYKQKDKLFRFENFLMGLVAYLMSQNYNFEDEDVLVIKELVLLVEDSRVPGCAIDKMFNFDKIERSDIMNLLEVVKPLTDEYQRGMLYQGLFHHQDSMNKFTVDAKSELAEFVSGEFAVYLKREDRLNDDEINNIEIAADICSYFINDELLNLLEKIIQLGHNRINFYAIETLLINGRQIEPIIISQIATDLEYANLMYTLLIKFSLTHMFPKELANAEYLAKSDMVRWLVYPTELGKLPCEIELLGTIVSDVLYYVFKYKSDSNNLDEANKNVWLIGWSSKRGGTFSHFSKLSDYEQKNLKKTLKIIKKKVIG